MILSDIIFKIPIDDMRQICKIEAKIDKFVAKQAQDFRRNELE
jgi:hypothetical protein